MMRESETQAIREMAAAAKTKSVRLARWQDDAPTHLGKVRVWVCGWYPEDDPDNTHHVGWRMTEEEMSDLCVAAAKLFADLVRPRKIRINGPAKRRNVN